MPPIFFTGCTHFNHANILALCRRPWTTMDEMNAELAAHWNRVVPPDGEVWHLGDFALGGGTADRYLDQLNGRIHLVYGNHDAVARRSAHRFASTQDYATISVERQRIILMHYPIIAWDKAAHGSWMLHSHCHGNLKDDPGALRLDVGVDVPEWGYAPVSFAQLQARMAQKSFVPVDHHGAPPSADGFGQQFPST